MAKKINSAEQYIQDVIKGRQVVCEYTRLAVERHLRDLKEGMDHGLFFDRRAAEHRLGFYKFLKHGKLAEFAGKPFVPSPWQAFIDWVTFGWKRDNGTREGLRRFMYVYIEIARKNGKTVYAAADGSYGLFADREIGSEIYSVATKEEQAKICLNEAKNIIRFSPMIHYYDQEDKSERLKIFQKSITHEETGSFFQPLGSDSKHQDGLNPHFVIIDEYHAHVSDDMVNITKSAMGAQTNPRMLIITTAGFNKTSPCYQERETCIKILKGILQQDNKFAIIYTLDEGDDWEDEKNWPKANPNLGISIKLDYLRNEYRDAINNPTKINNFKTKNLNIWTSTEVQWIRDEDWMQCAIKKLTLQDLIGRPCRVGLDLAKRRDINSLSVLFTDREPFDLYQMFWIPEWKVLHNSDDVDYRFWADQEYIRIQEGNAVDLEIVASEIIEILSHFKVLSIAIDRSYMEFGPGPKLTEKGLELNEFRQGFISMGPPTHELEAMIMEKKINHQGNPILRWMNSNVLAKIDDAGNIKISKGKSKNKVDGMVTLVMAIGEHLSFPEKMDLDQIYGNRKL